jgi:hypothetical protein
MKLFKVLRGLIEFHRFFSYCIRSDFIAFYNAFNLYFFPLFSFTIAHNFISLFALLQLTLLKINNGESYSKIKY